MSVVLESRDGAVILSIRAQPGARRNAIVGTHDGALKVSVTQAAEKGKANQAVMDVLCKQLELRPRQLELIRGAASRQKDFAIREIELDELQRRIARILSPAN